ncbi:MAG: Flp family type IVb pilin [Altererythrobacter sp.]|nr:Flp family type IVb pilin [Altererythrobacter sp.]
MFKFLARLGRDTKGATAVEYGLILALVFLAMVGAATTLGVQATNMWNMISNVVTSSS